MPRTTRTLPIKIYSLLAVIVTASLALPAQANNWAKYQSQNFTVYTDRNESQVRALIEELEIFRIIALLQLNLPLDQREHQKLAIVMFGNNREFRRVMQSRNVAGFFAYTSSGPRMVMGSGQRDVLSAKEILFHEYVHYLTFEHSAGFTYPRWYIEGLAEVLGSTKVERNAVVVGGRPASASSIDYFGVLRMADILQNRRLGERSENFESRFYGSAWLLTHYLQIDAGANDKQYGLKNREYLMRYHRGDDPVKAFEEVFETTLEDFDRLLISYSRQRRITVRNWTRPELDLQLTKNQIGETEKNFMIAGVLFSYGHEALALEYLTGISDEEDYFSEALAMRTVLLNHDEANADIAAQLANQLAASAPDSSSVFGDLAHYEWDNYQRFMSAGEYSRAMERLDAVEIHAKRGIELDPTEFNALWYLASVKLAKNEYEEALEILYDTWNIMPSNTGVRLEIVNILLRRGEIEEAKPVVRSLIGAAHTPELSDKLTTLLGQMESGQVDMSIFEQIRTQ